MEKILIKNSTIYDGTGAHPFQSDILIQNGKILSIGNLKELSDTYVIDGSGLALSPGFIDTHTHSDSKILNDTAHEHSLRQGVTTEILGQDGLSYAPLSPKNYRLNSEYLSGLLGNPPKNIDMSSVEKFRSHYDSKVSINTAYCVPHGAIRLESVGFKDLPLTGNALETAKNLVKESMDQGAVGMATGMSYFPNAWSDTQELIELCKIVKEKDGVYVTHLRDKNVDRAFGGGWVKEAIEIARKSGVKIHFSHYRTDKNTAGNIEAKMHLIDEGIREGLDITLELYPYPTGSTFPLSFLPSYAHENGIPGVIGLLSDKSKKIELADYLDNDFKTSTGPIGEVILSYIPKFPELEGDSLVNIAKKRGETVGMALCNLLLETKCQIGYWAMPPDEKTWDQINLDIVKLLSRKDYMVGSDSIPLGSYPHPRAYGTFPRIIGRFQRKYNYMQLSETIQRITENPAKRFKLNKRGAIKEGYFADIVIFDSDTVIDNATYENPKQYPSGIHYVIVNGKIAIEKGELKSSNSGKAIP